MQPSPELRAEAIRGLEATRPGNADAIIAMFSQQPGTMFIGTDPSEWITDRAALDQLIRASVETSSGRMPTDLRVEAFEEGTVGWALLWYTAALPTGARLTFRWTLIYHREGSAWKIVAGNVSLGVPDAMVPTIPWPQ